MASGGRGDFETVAWFNGSLVQTTTPRCRWRTRTSRRCWRCRTFDWSEIDPSILCTLFERGLNPDKPAQLGAHYTDREKIMLLVEPVVIRPLLAEWNVEKTDIAA